MTRRNKNGNTKLWLTIIGSAALVVVIIILIGKEEKGTEVTVEHPQSGSITEVIPANGKIRPVSEVKISPDVSGEIVELNVKEGDYVSKGDLLIKIKQDLYISSRDKAIAALNSAKSQYHQSEVQMHKTDLSYKRNKNLHEQGAISESEYEISLSEYLVAQEQLKAADFNIKSAEASLKEREEDLIKTTIFAPMHGIISRISVEKGERVVGTTQMAGTEMLRIADLDEMEVVVDVNENDIVRLHKGDTADISVDAYPDRKFKGTVTKIANSAKNVDAITDQVTNFQVKVLILPSSYADLAEEYLLPLRPGMSASVSIETEHKTDVIKVPVQCVTSRKDLSGDDKNAEYVFVYDESASKVKAVRVKTGIQDLGFIEITDGLSMTSKVVTGPYNAISKTLKDGDKVSVDTVSVNQ